MFATFEGIDGSGKSTQANMLVQFIQEQGITEVILTKEPYDRETRKRLLFKNNLSSVEEFELFLNDRRKHLDDLILPALHKGMTVISDRYMDSSTAYQGYGLFVPLEYIEKRQSNLYIPDLTFIMDINPEISLKRLPSRDNIEERGIYYLNRVRKGYLQIAEQNPNRCVVLNATLPVSKLHNQVVDIFKKRISKDIEI